MAPVGIIRMLSRTDAGTESAASMGLLKHYLSQVVERERAEIDRNVATTSTFLRDTQTKSAELAGLTDGGGGAPIDAKQPQTRKTFTNTRCTSCGYALDNPVTHFWCGHSFHVRCLNIPDDPSGPDADDGVLGGIHGRDGATAEGGVRPEERAKSAGVECPECAGSNEVIRGISRAQVGSRGKHGVFLEGLGRSDTGMKVVGEWMGRGVFGGDV